MPAVTQFDDQTILIDLSKDLDGLDGFEGKYTSAAPVIGVRWENLAGFDAKIHCNAVQPILYKPKIEHHPDGTITASVEAGRFHVDFDPAAPTRAWLQDPDPTGQFFWIFPKRYGRDAKGKAWSLTSSYDAELRKVPVGSAKRRWIAEAYLNLSMRTYRQSALSAHFPTGWRPTSDDLRTALEAKIGNRCTDTSEDLICLASRLIEKNEAAPPGNLIAPAAFRVGDAILENSGVSTGIRQLDFGTGNLQATQLARVLMPTTIGRYKTGYGYRRPIRTWTIGQMNDWYNVDGPIANAELSRDEAKRALIDSHIAYLQDAVGVWTRQTTAAYPNWTPQEREALSLIAIDTENVTGYHMRLPKGAVHLCDVFSDTVLKDSNSRNNSLVVHNKDRQGRLENGILMLVKFDDMADIDWSCVNTPRTALAIQVAAARRAMYMKPTRLPSVVDSPAAGTPPGSGPPITPAAPPADDSAVPVNPIPPVETPASHST